VSVIDPFEVRRLLFAMAQLALHGNRGIHVFAPEAGVKRFCRRRRRTPRELPVWRRRMALCTVTEHLDEMFG